MAIYLLVYYAVISTRASESVRPGRDRAARGTVAITVRSLPIGIHGLLPRSGTRQSMCLRTSRLGGNVFRSTRLCALHARGSSAKRKALVIRSTPVGCISRRKGLHFVSATLRPVSDIQSSCSCHGITGDFAMRCKADVAANVGFSDTFAFTIGRAMSSGGARGIAGATVSGMVCTGTFKTGATIRCVGARGKVGRGVVLGGCANRAEFSFAFHSRARVPVLTRGKVFV